MSINEPSYRTQIAEPFEGFLDRVGEKVKAKVNQGSMGLVKNCSSTSSSNAGGNNGGFRPYRR